jgi:hypothetical protein
MEVRFWDCKPLEASQVIDQVHLWLRINRAEDEGAVLGFQDGKRAAVAEAAPVPDLFGHHDVALFSHVNYSHGGKLPLKGRYSKPFLERVTPIPLSTGSVE